MIVAADLRSEELGDVNLVALPQADRSRTGSLSKHHRQPSSRVQRSPSLQSSTSDQANRSTRASVSEASSSLVSPAIRSMTLPDQPVDGAPARFTPSGLVRSRSTSQSETSPGLRTVDVYAEDDDMSGPEHPLKKSRSTHTDDETRVDTLSYQDSTRPIETASDVDEKLRAASIPNLIGTLHANAFKLKDDEGNPGIYFIFSDLSVRTEGQYKLRLRLFEIGAPRSEMEETDMEQGNAQRTKGSTGLAASAVTQTFQVMTAKKFEGMLEPSTLSRCFAKQGVRIPTRSSARRRKADDKDTTHAAPAAFRPE
ncbi:hypothetical protein OIV83_000734 [Microbotryomycetes sp. JL201]|nr:hypothetical protein OIV83_000734 [Microbotryomycetes sp. JL201]